MQPEQEEATSTLGEEVEQQDQEVDSQVVSHEIHDAMHLNHLLLGIHNNNSQGPHDSDNESLASTIPLGPSWEDGVPAEAIPGILARHGLQEPQPDKEEQHIAKAEKELSMSVP